MMNFDLLFETGLKSGLTDMEIYLVKNDNFSCKVFEQNVDSYSVSKTQGLSFRGVYEGKMGYTYTEKCDDSSIPFLVSSVIDNALLIEKDENDRHAKVMQEMREAIEKAERIEGGVKLEQRDNMGFDDDGVGVSGTTEQVAENTINNEGPDFSSSVVVLPNTEVKAEEREKTNMVKKEEKPKNSGQILAKPSIIELANNPDFSVATISKEANRLKERDEGEHFISLH